MTTPRLRPMSDTNRPAVCLLFYKCDDQPVEWTTVRKDYKTVPDDIGWCTLEEGRVILGDLIERIKPDEPNPVYWGDEVVSHQTGYRYVYIAQSKDDPKCAWCESLSDGIPSGRKFRHILTYNGKPITEFCHGKRPEEES